MAQYDGSIRINTEINTKDASSQLMKLENSMQKAADKVSSLRSKMDSLKDVHIPTQEYVEIQKQIEATEKKIIDLQAKQEKFLATGGKTESSAFQKMQYDLEELQNSLPYLQSELQDLVDTGKAFTLGSDTEQYANLGQQLQYEENNLAALNKRHDELIAKQGTVSERFSRMRSAAQKAFNAIRSGLSKIGNIGKKAFSGIFNMAKKAFSAITSGSKQSSGFLSNFTSQLKNIVSAAFVFNLIRKGFSSMVSGMKTGFTNLMAYSGNFANSIQSVKNSLSTLGNQIASAFAPIVQAVIPWLNQLISVLATAISYVSQFIAALTGKSTYIRAKKVQDSYNASLGGTAKKEEEVADNADNMSDALEDSAKAAKKAKNALAAFDDLDVLEKQDESTDVAAEKIKDLNNQLKDLGSGAGSGMGDLFEEVPIESSILDAVEKLKDILTQLFTPLKDAWEREGQFVLDSWKYALSETWQLMKDIGRDFLTMWNQQATVKMLSDILHIFGDIGLTIGNISHALDEAWNKNNTGLHILENIRDIFAIIIQNIRKAADFTVEWSKTLNLSPLLESIEHLTRSLVPFADFVSGTLADFYTQFILPLTSWALSEEGLPRLVNILGDLMDTVDWESLRESLKNLYTALEPYAEAIGEGLIDFIEKLKDIGVAILNSLPEPIQKLANALTSGDPQKVREWTTTILEFAVAIEGIKLAFMGFEIVQSGLALFGIGGVASAVATTATEAAGGITLLSSALSGLVAVAGGLGIVEALKDPIVDLAEAAGVSSDKADYMGERYRGLGGDLNLIKDPVSILTNGFQGLGWEMSNAMGTSGALDTAMNNIAEGMIYTDDQLSKMQKNFGLTNDDMEMLRQAMLDTHPELRNLADGFEGLNDASAETLSQINDGFEYMENGISDVDDVVFRLNHHYGELTPTAQDFFERIKEGTDYFDYYESAVKNSSETTKQFSEDIVEAGDNIASGITEGFEKADVETPVAGFFSRVKESLMSIFDMHSPAKNMEPFGENIFLGVVEGFKASFSAFTDAASEWWENYVAPWFSAERWGKLGENIRLIFTELWLSIYESTVETWTMIQEYFTEFWTLFIESLTETWETILLLFTEKWEEIRLVFEEFLTFLNEIFLVSWLETWTLAGQQYQTFSDLLTTLTKAIQDMLTLFMEQIEMLIKTIWKNSWNNAKNIFEEFKGKMQEISNSVREIVQSLFDFVMELVAEMLAAIESVGSAASSISAGGEFAGASSGGGSPFSAARTASYSLDSIPQLANGAVIRGGNPFMAILGDQRVGQTNVEAPAGLIRDMVREGIREEMGNFQIGGGQIKIAVQVNGADLAQVTLDDFLSEMNRQGYNVDLLGYT